MLSLNGQAMRPLLTAGPPHSISATQICRELSKIKCGKAAGPSGIIAEMLKAAGEEVVELVRKLTEAVFSSGMIPMASFTNMKKKN